MNKPFSQACENNKTAILQKIETVFTESTTVWEIGSGTGQHACYFAQHLPHVTWQPTDRQENLAGINHWIHEADLANLNTALALDVAENQWACEKIEALFTANTLHIMSWQQVEYFFAGLKKHLSKNAVVCIYGAFNYNGLYTSESNAQFDQWLKARDPNSGLRDYEAIEILANASDLKIQHDFAMPANNRMLVLQQ